MPVQISAKPFDPYQAICDFERKHLRLGQFGAKVHFIGVMRDHNEGKRIIHMWLEHYPGMTETCLQHIITDAMQKYAATDALVVHRTGDITPGQTIVLIAVWARHRKAALRACDLIIEKIKTHAPFWKKEYTAGGAHWVKQNTPFEMHTQRTQ